MNEVINKEQVKEIVSIIKKEFQDEAMEARKLQELAKITDQIDQLNADDSLKETEKEMHMSFLEFNKKKTELIYSDVDKAKEFEQIEMDYNKENDVSVIRINPQGDSVIELRVPKQKIDNFDALLKTSGEYWADLGSKLDEIING